MVSTAPQENAEEVFMPVSDVLLAVAGELEQLRSLGFRIERAVCVLAVRAGADAEVIGELQHLDALIQQVAALHDFLLNLSNTQKGETFLAVSKALERLTLRDVKERLTGGSWNVGNSGGLELL